jgi:DeoR family transcriptional regulator of aga operon
MRKKAATKRRPPQTLDGEDMLIDEPRQHILGLLQSDGRVLVAELSSQLGISQITIRKDLDHLEAKG